MRSASAARAARRPPVVRAAKRPERPASAACSTALFVARMQAASSRRMARASSTSARRSGPGAHLAVAERQQRALEPGVDQIILERPLVLEILLRLAALHLEQRRLGDEEMPVLDDRPHLPEEEGQQQRADVRAVDVGVGHDDDLVVAQLLHVEVVAADAGAERGDQRADLLAPEHLVEARPLDVEDLAAQAAAPPGTPGCGPAWRCRRPSRPRR